MKYDQTKSSQPFPLRVDLTDDFWNPQKNLWHVWNSVCDAFFECHPCPASCMVCLVFPDPNSRAVFGSKQFGDIGHTDIQNALPNLIFNDQG